MKIKNNTVVETIFKDKETLVATFNEEFTSEAILNRQMALIYFDTLWNISLELVNTGNIKVICEQLDNLSKEVVAIKSHMYNESRKLREKRNN